MQKYELNETDDINSNVYYKHNDVKEALSKFLGYLTKAYEIEEVKPEDVISRAKEFFGKELIGK